MPHIGNRPQDVRRFLEMSLKRLKVCYVDLYLIHLPFAFICDETTLTPAVDCKGNFKLDKATDHVAVWRVIFLLYFFLPRFSQISGVGMVARWRQK